MCGGMFVKFAKIPNICPITARPLHEYAKWSAAITVQVLDSSVISPAWYCTYQLSLRGFIYTVHLIDYEYNARESLVYNPSEDVQGYTEVILANIIYNETKYSILLIILCILYAFLIWEAGMGTTGYNVNLSLVTSLGCPGSWGKVCPDLGGGRICPPAACRVVSLWPI